MKKVDERTFIWASNRPWAIEAFINRRSELQGNWALVTDSGDLDAVISRLEPRYIFFPHWSKIVPSQIIKQYECVCFHMTDLPFGRGGSPLQNLIARGFKDTKVSALRMVDELDAGPVYFKRSMSLDGTASEIFERVSNFAIEMAKEIILNEPTPQSQVGEIVDFSRRKPHHSEMGEDMKLETCYDHIRMLDAPGYPNGFINYGNLKISFVDASFEGNKIRARAVIEENNE